MLPIAWRDRLGGQAFHTIPRSHATERCGADSGTLFATPRCGGNLRSAGQRAAIWTRESAGLPELRRTAPQPSAIVYLAVTQASNNRALIRSRGMGFCPISSSVRKAPPAPCQVGPSVFLRSTRNVPLQRIAWGLSVRQIEGSKLPRLNLSSLGSQKARPRRHPDGLSVYMPDALSPTHKPPTKLGMFPKCRNPRNSHISDSLFISTWQDALDHTFAVRTSISSASSADCVSASHVQLTRRAETASN